MEIYILCLYASIFIFRCDYSFLFRVVYDEENTENAYDERIGNVFNELSAPENAQY